MSHPDVEKDYYSILGAGETASQDEIERLYKRLAKRHHPTATRAPVRLGPGTPGGLAIETLGKKRTERPRLVVLSFLSESRYR